MGLLDGKTAIVTGAARGMGREIAIAMDAAGAALILFDRNLDGVVDTASRLRKARPVSLDVSDYKALAAALSDVSVVDVLVNNVGGPINADGDAIHGPFLDSDPEVWEAIFKFNLRAPANLIHICAPKMPQGGRIVNIGSDAGRLGSPGEAFYAATKGGVITLTKTLAIELGVSHGISVNCVCPGPTNTPLMQQYLTHKSAADAMRDAVARTPLKRMATVQDIASAVMFFATGTEYVSGQILSVSGALLTAG
jgi:2-hydroxycyclohexanecarboxyl-CoA dehydrogenase